MLRKELIFPIAYRDGRNSPFRKLLYIQIRARRALKKDGVLFLLKKLARKIKYLTFRTTCSIWFCKSLSEPVDSTAKHPDIDINFLKEDKSRLINWLREHNARFPWMYKEKEIQLAETDKHIYASILHHGDIIGYIKVGINNVYIHDFDKAVCFPNDSAFVYDTFILPEYRGKNIASYAISRTIDFLREAGFKKLWCHIEKWNTASLKTFQKAGFIPKGTIRFSRVLGLPIFIKNGYIPLIGLKAFISQ